MTHSCYSWSIDFSKGENLSCSLNLVSTLSAKFCTYLLAVLPIICLPFRRVVVLSKSCQEALCMSSCHLMSIRVFTFHTLRSFRKTTKMEPQIFVILEFGSFFYAFSQPFEREKTLEKMSIFLLHTESAALIGFTRPHVPSLSDTQIVSIQFAPYRNPSSALSHSHTLSPLSEVPLIVCALFRINTLSPPLLYQHYSSYIIGLPASIVYRCW